MNTQITQKMINDFNEYMQEIDCIIQLKSKTIAGNIICKISAQDNMMFIKNFNIIPDNNFYIVLKKFFKNNNINLIFNYNKIIFWGE